MLVLEEEHLEVDRPDASWLVFAMFRCLRDQGIRPLLSRQDQGPFESGRGTAPGAWRPVRPTVSSSQRSLSIQTRDEIAEHDSDTCNLKAYIARFLTDAASRRRRKQSTAPSANVRDSRLVDNLSFHLVF
jgi:hypothetical protein